jgi:hypothetical protein
MLNFLFVYKPDVIFYERNRVNTPGRKPRFTKSISFAERLKRKHQQRIKQLEKSGWYKYFDLVQKDYLNK